MSFSQFFRLIKVNARDYRLSVQSSVELLFREKRLVSDCLTATAMSIHFVCIHDKRMLNRPM